MAQFEISTCAGCDSSEQLAGFSDTISYTYIAEERFGRLIDLPDIPIIAARASEASFYGIQAKETIDEIVEVGVVVAALTMHADSVREILTDETFCERAQRADGCPKVAAIRPIFDLMHETKF